MVKKLGIQNVCMDDIMKEYNILGHIRSGYFGDVYAVSKGKHKQIREYTSLPPYRGKSFEFVIKVVINNKESMDEIKTLYMLQKLKSPHLPVIKSHHKCNNVNFRGWKKYGVALSYTERGDWTFVKKGKGILTIMENSGISMDSYIKKNKCFMNEVHMVFQLAYAIYTLEQKRISHNDIFIPNITCKRTTEQSMTYIVNKQIMEIPILDGHIPVLIDFGQTNTYTSKSKADVEDLLMLLKTWSYYTELPSMANLLRMLIKRNKSENTSTKDFLIHYYDTYINHTSIHK